MAYITQKKKPSLPKNDFETLARQVFLKTCDFFSSFKMTTKKPDANVDHLLVDFFFAF